MPPVIKSRKGRVFDITVTTNHDMVKVMKKMKGKVFFKEQEKGMSKALITVQSKAQRNITAMKAVLSGHMRNNWERFIVRPKLMDLTGVLMQNSWYAWMVHEGLGVHSDGGKPNSEKGDTPANIRRLQSQRLRSRKGRSPKGRRPFFWNAVKDSYDDIAIIIAESWQKGFERIWQQSIRRQKRAIKKSGVV